MPETEEVDLKDDGDFALPGDKLAYAVELAPGEGAHEDGEFTCASWTGIVQVDNENREVGIDPVVSTPVEVQEDDEVIVHVTRTRSSMAIGEVVAVEGKEGRNVTGDTEATLHISKISEDYVDEIEDAFRPGDIIRALVISADPSIQIFTEGDEYGVLKAFCQRCRTPYEQDDGRLQCPNCEFKDERKLSERYGKGLAVEH